jgi:hypothetical protein
MIQRSDLKRMSSGEIVAAFRKGELDHLLQAGEQRRAREREAPDASDDIDQGARSKPPRSVRESVRQMTPQQIVAAHRRGDLDALLRGEVT